MYYDLIVTLFSTGITTRGKKVFFIEACMKIRGRLFAFFSLNFGVTWRLVFNVKPWPLYPQKGKYRHHEL